MDKIDEALSISIGLSQNNLQDEGMLLCLCPTCASQFYNSPEHIIRRADPFQSVKGACTYCSVRMGYDYKISRKK